MPLVPLVSLVSLTLVTFPSVAGSLFLRHSRSTPPATASTTANPPTLAPTMTAICLALSGFAVVSEEPAAVATLLSIVLSVVEVEVGMEGRALP